MNPSNPFFSCKVNRTQLINNLAPISKFVVAKEDAISSSFGHRLVKLTFQNNSILAQTFIKRKDLPLENYIAKVGEYHSESNQGFTMEVSPRHLLATIRKAKTGIVTLSATKPDKYRQSNLFIDTGDTSRVPHMSFQLPSCIRIKEEKETASVTLLQEGFRFSLQEFAQSINKALPSVTENEHRPMSQHIRVEMDKDKSQIVSTDGNTLNLERVAYFPSQHHRLDIPLSTMKAIAMLAKTYKEEDVVFRSDQESLLVANDNDALYQLCVADHVFELNCNSSRYPDYNRVIPNRNNPKASFVGDVQETLQHIKNGRERHEEHKKIYIKTHIGLKDNAVLLSHGGPPASCPIESFCDTILVSNSFGEERLICIDSKFLIDALSVMDCEKYEFRFSGDEEQAITLHEADNQDTFRLVMPLTQSHDTRAEVAKIMGINLTKKEEVSV